MLVSRISLVAFVSPLLVLIWNLGASAYPTPSFVGLGDLPGGSFASYPNDISADGQVVIGRSDSSNFLSKSFRWTRQGGMVDLGGSEDSEPWGISDDGSTIVGELWQHNGGYDAYKWTATQGMQLLTGIPPPPSQTKAKAISGDGLVTAGLAIDGNNAQLNSFRWTQANGFQILGSRTDAYVNAQAHGMSGDGRVITGTGDTINGAEAFRWTEATGMVSIGDLPGGLFQSNGLDASWDGSVIVGAGRNPQGRPEGWLAVIPEPGCALSLLIVIILLGRGPPSGGPPEGLPGASQAG